MEETPTQTGIIEKLQAFYAEHTQACLLLGAGLVLGVLVMLLIFVQSSPQQGTTQQKELTNEETGKQLQSTSKTPAPPNPLIDNQERERVKEAYRKKEEKQGIISPSQPEYKFEFRLKGGQSSLFSIPQVEAAGACLALPIGTNVPVYTLKNHYNASEAIKIAKNYGFTSSPTQLPALDGSNTYEYSFSDTKENILSRYLNIKEPSGMYEYHIANKEREGTKTDAEIVSLATKALTTYKIDSKVELKYSSLTKVGPFMQVFFNKKYGQFATVDDFSINELLIKNLSVCTVGLAQRINGIRVDYTKKGDIESLINNTRTVEKVLQAPIASLSEILDEYREDYKENPLVEPHIYGKPSGSVKDLVPTEVDHIAQLVYYDYGFGYGQKAYVPMYLINGTAPSLGNVRVITLFPAIKKADLDAIGLAASSNTTLQLETFNPPPPPPAAKPTDGGPGGGIGPFTPVACSGGMIDYTMSCTLNGEIICQPFMFEVPVNTGDPLGVCGNGCQSKSGTVKVDPGQDACLAFLEQNNIDPYNYKAVVGTGGAGHKNTTGGVASCTLRGCPC